MKLEEFLRERRNGRVPADAQEIRFRAGRPVCYTMIVEADLPTFDECLRVGGLLRDCKIVGRPTRVGDVWRVKYEVIVNLDNCRTSGV